MVKRNKHIAFLFTFFLMVAGAMAQEDVTRYVELNSTHSFAVPENPAFKYVWEVKRGLLGQTINVGQDSANVTRRIDFNTQVNDFYRVAVYPILDSVGCRGEAITMRVNVLSDLPLHAFDDTYNTPKDQTVHGNVSLNDFDDNGYNLVYLPHLIVDPKHGAVDIKADGTFTYVPSTGFIGLDSFKYEVCNDADPLKKQPYMCDNAWVFIVVEPKSDFTDIQVFKTGDSKVLYGGEIYYQIVVKNAGPGVAKDVVLRDVVPYGVYDPKYSLNYEPLKPWPDILTIGSIAVNDSVIVQIYATVSRFAASRIYNQGLAYSDNPDPEPINNDSIWPTDVMSIFTETLRQTVPLCKPDTLKMRSQSVNGIKSITWSPATYLNNANLMRPLFTPTKDIADSVMTYLFTLVDSLNNTITDTAFVYVPPAVEVVLVDTFFIDIGETDTLFANQSKGHIDRFLWTTLNGVIKGPNRDSALIIGDTGIYVLEIRDRYGCFATDSVVVLYESYPPVVVTDSVAIVAGTDSTFNVLDNDYDINKFKIKVTDIKTYPKHSTLIDWDSLGNFTVKPDSNYWRLDSLEYEVCNNGIPVRCNTGWVIINCLRPPLNADAVVEKHAPKISFWGDSILYDINIFSLGPDTLTQVTLYDYLDFDLASPHFSVDNGATWKIWQGTQVFTDSIYPRVDTLNIKIRAYIDIHSGRDTIMNKAYIKTTFKENNRNNDTSIVYTIIKEPVFAIAGKDTLLGACHSGIYLDGSKSTGEELQYLWTSVPSSYIGQLSSQTVANPWLTRPGNITTETTVKYILTVTDNDYIQSVDTVEVVLLQTPVANAGPDLFLELNKEVVKPILVDGRNSTPKGKLDYLWTTDDGHIAAFETEEYCYADSLGTYVLTVTDRAGCTSTDTVVIYEYFFPPFAIPDYYSIHINETVNNGNVLENDFDPNGRFNLSVIPETVRTGNGNRLVTIDANGIFNYNPAGFVGVDYFYYQVCNDAIPPRCARGYVQITVGNPPPSADLHIEKSADKQTVVTGGEVIFYLDINNFGPDEATGVKVRDSLSQYILNPKISINNGVSFSNFNNNVPIQTLSNIPVGGSIRVILKGTVSDDAPSKIYNAAMVYSNIFDPIDDWSNEEHRNVDTTSVNVVSDLLAIARFIEDNPNDDNKNDGLIGACDVRSYLTGANSAGMDLSFRWAPRAMLNAPDNVITTLLPTAMKQETTVKFDLEVKRGEKVDLASVNVRISPKPVADAGIDRKINTGDVLVLDATKSVGANATFYWYNIDDGNTPVTNFEDNDRLRPIINTTGRYVLHVVDRHGCQAFDTIKISENSLMALNDIGVLIRDIPFKGYVSTNDYDPNLDSIYYTGEVIEGPFRGTLQVDPPRRDGIVATADGRKIAPDGAYVYTPNTGFIGNDYFVYRVCDNNDPDLCMSAKVYLSVIDVDSVNTPPVANHDELFVVKNDTVMVNLLYNDYDIDGGQIYANVANFTTSMGRVSITKEGDLTYIPNNNTTGVDSFKYVIYDNGKPVAYDTAQVTVYIHKLVGENHNPVAVDDAYYVVAKPIEGNVLDNDYDPDNGQDITLEPKLIYGPQQGTVVMSAARDGSFTYTPKPGFEGTDQFVYQICDTGLDPECSQSTVYITCIDPNRFRTDLQIVKTGTKEVMSGGVINYTLKINVNGPTLANDVTYFDTIPKELINPQFSIDGITWSAWSGKEIREQMMLYDSDSIKLRATTPFLFDTTVTNTGWVDHAMREKDSTNNVSSWSTRVFQSVVADAGRDTTIGGCVPTYQLSALGSIGFAPDNLSYKWTPTTHLSNANSATPVFNTVPGKHTFVVTVTGETGTFKQIQTDTVVITVTQLPIAEAGQNQFPENSVPVLLDGNQSFGVAPVDFLWWNWTKTGDTLVHSNAVTVSVNRSARYYLTITDVMGCSNTDSVYVGFPIDPYIAVEDIRTTYQQYPDTIKFLRNDIIDDEDNYDWTQLVILDYPTHGTLVINPQDSTIIYIPEDYYVGPDSFQYSMGTMGSQPDAAWVRINVVERLPEIPKAFSPNGDGINDFLIIKHIELYKYNKITIFNRWGNVVYVKENYSNDEPWDGIPNKGIRVGSGIVPTATYLYILDLGDLGDEERNKNYRLWRGNIYVASHN